MAAYEESSKGARSYSPREFCALGEGSRNGRRAVFLAGVTNPSSAYERWRERAKEVFQEESVQNVDIIDPLDPNWVPECLQYERESLEMADSIFCALSEDALGIISLMELVAMAHKGKRVVVISKKMENLYYRQPGSGEMKECSSGVNYARAALQTYLVDVKFVEVDTNEDLMEVIVNTIRTEYAVANA